MNTYRQSSLIVKKSVNLIMDKVKPRVFVSCVDFPQEALQLLKNKCDVSLCIEGNPSKEQVYNMVKDMDALLWFWLPCTFLDKNLLDAAGPQLKIISLMSSGHEHLDMKEVKRRGIRVGYVPNLQNESVADMAITLLLAVIHRYQEGRERIKIGDWGPWRQYLFGYEICQSTVGIVGLGGIGTAIAKRLRAFEVSRLLYSGPSQKSEADTLKAEYVSFDELLRQSDYVIIACRLTAETRGMFNDDAFNKMKPNAVVINIARGAIVDHAALQRALETGTIWGAGLDVTVPEPLPSDSPLLRFHNCVIMPHVGSATVKTRGEMALLAAQNLLAGLEGQPMPSPLAP